MRLKYSLAAAAAVAALMPQAQEGGPPSSEDPGYGRDEDEVETIIVIGNRYRCPNGTLVYHVVNCPSFVSFSINYNLAQYDPVSHMIRQTQSTAQTCGAPVDANCECGDGKVKVYDESADEFHCYTEPPADGCPKWDQTFDFDLNVWACVTGPFDDSAVDAAERIKNCVGGVVSANWSRLSTLLRWGSAGGNWGVVGCSGNEVTYVELNRQLYESRAAPGHSSPWQYMAHTLIHEALHVEDIGKSKTCQPWTDETMQNLITANGGWPHTEVGYEAYTHQRTLDEYRTQLGVESPHDPFNYDPAVHGKVPCLLH